MVTQSYHVATDRKGAIAISKDKSREWLPECVKVNKVKSMYNYYVKTLINRVTNMFAWGELPDTVDENFLAITLVTQGRVIWTEVNGKLYALSGNYGGEPNVYYYPSQYIISNPILGSKIVDIDKTGVLMYLTDTDKMCSNGDTGGLYGLISTTAQLLSDNVSSINIAQRNTRVTALVTAGNQAQKISAENAIQRMYDGDPYEVVLNDLINSLTINPMVENTAGGAQYIRELVELNQYILAQFYHSIGVNANYNMKRERVSGEEIAVNDECLIINVIDMLNNLQEAVKKINAMFNTHITVDFSKEWKGVLNNYNQRQVDKTDNSEINSDTVVDNNSDDNNTAE